MRMLAAALIALAAPGASAAEKPNVVIILCDDLGYGDVKCFNPSGKIPTPNMDKLAAAGMMFTDAHTASGVCTPTRYGVMTGRYPWRTPLQKGVLGGLSPRLIEQNRATVASFLKSQGYHTSAVGKWHLGMDWALKPGTGVTKYSTEPRSQVFNPLYDQPVKNGPNSVGFDYFFGISASLDMVPYTFIENDRVTKLPTEDREFPMMAGQEKKMTRKGPAAPGFAVEDVLPTLTAKACEIIQARARGGEPFFLYLAFSSPHTPIAPTSAWNKKSGINPYADFVMQTDHGIGEVLAAIEKAGIEKNTLVIFTSDNGCAPNADFPALLAKGHNPNYVFRGSKADIYEGGHHVPFAVRWPGHVQPGASGALVSLNDIFRTCADVLGQKLPDDAAEDSISFLPVLQGKPGERAAIVHLSANGSFAIRGKDMKLCFCPGSGGWSKPRPGVDDTSTMPARQLFDLKADLGEKVNLIDKQPQTVEKLTELLERYVADGRSTPGAKQKNAVKVDIRIAGEEAHQPLNKRKVFLMDYDD